MTVTNEYIVLIIGAIVGFSIPAIILGILCMTNTLLFYPIFGAIWFTFGCTGIGTLVMFLLWKQARLPSNYY